MWGDISLCFWFIFPWWLVIWTPFHVPVDHLYVFFGKMSVQILSVQFSSVQLLNCVWLFATSGTAARQASLSIINSWSLPTQVHWVGDAIQPSHPLSSPSPPAFNLSEHQGLFKWVSSSHEVAKILELQLQHQSFQWTPRTELLLVGLVGSPWSQGTLKSLLQHHSSKASILRLSAFFTVQLSHPYMTTGKTIALTRCTFVDKVMSLLFNMLSRLAITFLPRSKHLLSSWLQSPSAVIWFFAVKLYEFLIYCEYYPFIRYMLYKYFLPFSRLPFHFVDGFLCCAEASLFDIVPIVYFCLVLWFMGSQRVGHDWATDLIWSDSKKVIAKIDVKEFTTYVFS